MALFDRRLLAYFDDAAHSDGETLLGRVVQYQHDLYEIERELEGCHKLLKGPQHGFKARRRDQWIARHKDEPSVDEVLRRDPSRFGAAAEPPFSAGEDPQAEDFGELPSPDAEQGRRGSLGRRSPRSQTSSAAFLPEPSDTARSQASSAAFLPEPSDSAFLEGRTGYPAQSSHEVLPEARGAPRPGGSSAPRAAAAAVTQDVAAGASNLPLQAQRHRGERPHGHASTASAHAVEEVPVRQTKAHAAAAQRAQGSPAVSSHADVQEAPTQPVPRKVARSSFIDRSPIPTGVGDDDTVWKDETVWIQLDTFYGIPLAEAPSAYVVQVCWQDDESGHSERTEERMGVGSPAGSGGETCVVRQQLKLDRTVEGHILELTLLRRTQGFPDEEFVADLAIDVTDPAHEGIQFHALYNQEGDDDGLQAKLRVARVRNEPAVPEAALDAGPAAILEAALDSGRGKKRASVARRVAAGASKEEAGGGGKQAARGRAAAVPKVAMEPVAELQPGEIGCAFSARRASARALAAQEAPSPSNSASGSERDGSSLSGSGSAEDGSEWESGESETLASSSDVEDDPNGRDI